MIHQSQSLDLEHAVKVSDQVKNTEHQKNKKEVFPRFVYGLDCLRHGVRSQIGQDVILLIRNGIIRHNNFIILNNNSDS